jgi:chemotaxis protein histidine kinase CheA
MGTILRAISDCRTLSVDARLESASVPQSHDPKPDGPQGTPSTDGELARAYQEIKSAGEDLARLDRMVSGLERGSDSPPSRQEGAGAAPAAADEAPAPENQARAPGRRWNRLMRPGLVGLLLAIGIIVAAFASRYGNEAKAIMARWSPQAATAPLEVSELRAPPRPPIVQVADADQQPSPPAPSSRKEADDVPSTGATASGDPTSADLAQSLKTIAQSLAGIDDKLEQLKSSHERALRDHADAIQQLKAAQEQGARDNARIAGHVQALQTQLAALSAKSAARSLAKENEAARPQPAAAPRRPKRPRTPWMPPPYMVEPWVDPDW